MENSAKAKASGAEAFFGPKPAKGEEVVDRYTKDERALHWVTAVTWVILFITGIFLFVPVFGGGARGGVSPLLHHIAAVVVVAWAVGYFVRHPMASLKGIMFALKWGMADFNWLKAAPAYYFFGKEEKMPPQEHMNTGQKLWWLIVLGAGALMILTGAIMLFFRSYLPSWVYLVAALFHALGMVALFTMALVHVYLSVFHPKMRGIFWSMVNGTVPAWYAESHHKKWYEELKAHKK